MTAKVYVNQERTKVVEAGDPEAAWSIHRKEAERLGLIESEAEGKRKTARATAPRTKKNAEADEA